MGVTTVIINAFALFALGAAFIKRPAGARGALAIAVRAFVGLLPMMLAIILLIGLLLGLVPPATIAAMIGEESGPVGVAVAAGIGAVLFVPALIAFPLAASLLQAGASVGAVAAFITSLTLIGTVTLPVELRELGVKLTVVRNALGVVFALVIAVLMGRIL